MGRRAHGAYVLLAAAGLCWAIAPAPAGAQRVPARTGQGPGGVPGGVPASAGKPHFDLPQAIGFAVAGPSGYWAAYADGQLAPAGTAATFQFPSWTPRRTVAVAATPDGHGLWQVGKDGDVTGYGNAKVYGSAPGRDIAAVLATADGKGYWLVSRAGDVFAFGDAHNYGSLNVHSPSPVVAGAALADGYWLVTASGSVYGFGAAKDYGSLPPGQAGNPVVSMAAVPGGDGYWVLNADGTVHAFGHAPMLGSAVSDIAHYRATGISAVAIVGMGTGYWVFTSSGNGYRFDAPPVPARPTAAMPVVNISQTPEIEQMCNTGVAGLAQNRTVPVGTTAECNTAALAGIDEARASEGLPPLRLPPGTLSLPYPRQIEAITNAERTSRGLIPLPENPTADAAAAKAAPANEDPSLGSGFSFGNWAMARTPLEADFGWMYDDGPGSNTQDCKGVHMSGCWGHRIDILAPCSAGYSGAASVLKYKSPIPWYSMSQELDCTSITM